MEASNTTRQRDKGHGIGLRREKALTGAGPAQEGPGYEKSRKRVQRLRLPEVYRLRVDSPPIPRCPCSGSTEELTAF